MKFSGKMYLNVILKVTKIQGFTLSLEDTFFKKPQGKGEVQIDAPAVLELILRGFYKDFSTNRKTTIKAVVFCIWFSILLITGAADKIFPTI